MKHVILAAAGTLAIMSGAAYAGGGCNYGKHTAQLAEAEVPATDTVEVTDPQLLAKLKKQEEAALEQVITAPVIHN